MSEAAAEFSRGLTALGAGDQAAALSGFLMALAIDPETPAHRHKALELLGLTSNYTTLPQAVVDGLIYCTKDPEIDLQPLALVVRTLLQHNPMRDQWLTLTHEGGDALELALDNGSLDGLLTDALIQAVLSHAINISLDIEDLLTGLRRHGLLNAIDGSGSVLLARHRGFFKTLAIQAERTDFAWAVTEDELAQLDKLNSITDGRLTLSAYRKLEAVDAPPLPELTAISDTVSRTVQSQYKTFPYPRWERLPPANASSLAQVLTDRFPNQNWPERFSGPVTGLSAGCGTGSGALQLARTMKDIDLTAMDLSPASLAFAVNKADELGVTSVKFGIGDILNLPGLDTRFDIIECSGVLHHMKNPAKGLSALCACLAPDGVLRLALYSERGRVGVVAARSWIKEENIDDTVEEIRHARQQLRALPADHPAKPVIETPEFFVLSGLHDLIFNVQEHRFTPLQIKALLNSANLEFLGFDFRDPGVAHRYAQAFPDDAAQTDLDNWDEFEQKHPDTFAEMYQMWCRPSHS